MPDAYNQQGGQHPRDGREPQMGQAERKAARGQKEEEVTGKGIASFGSVGDDDADGMDDMDGTFDWPDDGDGMDDMDDTDDWGGAAWGRASKSRRSGQHDAADPFPDEDAGAEEPGPALGELSMPERLASMLGLSLGRDLPAREVRPAAFQPESGGHMPWALAKSREVKDEARRTAKGKGKRGGTSQELLDLMHTVDHDHASLTDRRYRDFLAAAGDATEGGEGDHPFVARGSVTLSFIARYDDSDAWEIRFTVSANGGRQYVVKDLGEFMRAMEHGDVIAYGKQLAFAHGQEMFDERSRQLWPVMRRMLEARSAAFMPSSSSWGYYGSPYSYGYSRIDGYKDIGVSQAQLVQLLDLVGNGTVAIETQDDDAVFRKHAVRVFATNPMMGIRIERVSGRGKRRGYRIEHAASVVAFIRDGEKAYALIEHDPDDLTLHRCSPGFMEASAALETLCPPVATPYFLADEHRALFARTMLPQLLRPEVGADVPDELRRLRVDPCKGEFYLDRDPYGSAVCRAVASYGEREFEMFPEAGDASSADSAAMDGRDFSRDGQAERLIRAAVSRYFTIPDAHDDGVASEGMADAAAGVYSNAGSDAVEDGADAAVPAIAVEGLPYVSDDDADGMLRLLTEGLPALSAVGAVYTTPRFDALLHARPAKVDIGLSVRHDLIVLSALSDEIPADQIGSVLDSYRRHRRYHRLADGTFLDLDKADLGQLDDLSDRLGIDGKQLDGGEVELPGYDGFMLDAEEDVEKDESFTRYLDDFRVVDPSRYVLPASLDGVLRPYQVDGFRWLNALIDKNFGGILADEMGLGKSLQLISMLLSRRGELAAEGPALIVCPASLVYNWAGEFRKFAPDMRYATVAGTKSSRAALIASAAPLPPGDSESVDDVAVPARADDAPEVLITSYDLLRRDMDLYQGRRFHIMAIDEAQVIKNRGTKVAKAVKSITADHRLALTGTPIENRLSELWSIFDFLMPGMLASYPTFRARYERPVFDGDEAATARLKALVSPFILRRLKKDVLKDLPDKIEEVLTVRLEGEQRKLYGAHEKQLLLFLKKSDGETIRMHRIQILSELTAMREICCDPRLLYDNAKDASAKLAAIEELVESSIDGGHKMLIFSQFTSFLRLIAARLDAKGIRYDEITGDTPKKERVELVDRFNGDDTPVFLISLKAGGTGLNLTGASVVVHADPWWNAAAQNQATDRAHRIGQTETVNVIQVVAEDTIEERIVEMQREKSKLAASIIGATGEAGTGLGELTRDDLLRLLQ